jgi:SPP1 family predicted phage head-tail adaptor
MRPGPMDRRITIQRVTYVDDGLSYIEEYNDLFDCWAEVRQTGGREFLTAAQVMSERRVVFYLRWYPGLLVTDRVIYDARQHNILEVREVGRRDGVELHTVAQG